MESAGASRVPGHAQGIRLGVVLVVVHPRKGLASGPIPRGAGLVPPGLVPLDGAEEGLAGAALGVGETRGLLAGSRGDRLVEVVVGMLMLPVRAHDEHEQSDRAGDERESDVAGRLAGGHGEDARAPKGRARGARRRAFHRAPDCAPPRSPRLTTS